VPIFDDLQLILKEFTFLSRRIPTGINVNIGPKTNLSFFNVRVVRISIQMISLSFQLSLPRLMKNSVDLILASQKHKHSLARPSLIR